MTFLAGGVCVPANLGVVVGGFGRAWAGMARVGKGRQVCIVSAGLGFGVGEFGQTRARAGKGGQVWMGQTDLT